MNRLVRPNDPAFRHTYEGPDDMPSHIKNGPHAGRARPSQLSRVTSIVGTWQGLFFMGDTPVLRPHTRRTPSDPTGGRLEADNGSAEGVKRPHRNRPSAASISASRICQFLGRAQRAHSRFFSTKASRSFSIASFWES